MTKELVTGKLWEVGRIALARGATQALDVGPRIDDRLTLTGILFVLKTAIL